MFLFKEIQLEVYTHMLVSGCQLELCMYNKQYDKKFKSLVQLSLIIIILIDNWINRYTSINSVHGKHKLLIVYQGDGDYVSYS